MSTEKIGFASGDAAGGGPPDVVSGGGSNSFLLVVERSPNSFSHESFQDEASARAAAKRRWGSSVIFEACENTLVREVSCGGLGFGHPAIRKHTSSRLLRADASAFLLLLERGPNNIVLERHAEEAAARASARREWCCWVLYAQIGSADEPRLCEIGQGGYGFGHAAIRRYASEHHGAMSSASDDSTAATVLREKASRVADPSLSQPLQEAVERLEAAKVGAADSPPPPSEAPPPLPDALMSSETAATEAAPIADLSAGELAEASSGTSGGLRARFGSALAHTDDLHCADGLVLLMQACLDGEGGADELVESLVQTLKVDPPRDEEMVRLRSVQDKYTDGMRGYAVASAWLSALFVRTERCIAARARLTQTVMSLDDAQRETLRHAGTRLVDSALPELQHLFGELAALVGRISNDVGVQQVSVRVAKGVSAAMSITGSVLVFTPLMPVGVGLLAGSAGIGITTATGDAIGQHVQKEDLRKGLDRLNECEERVLLLLEALLAACFQDTSDEDWAAARGAGISFETMLPEQINNTLFAVGGATARGAAGVASRIGATVSTQALSVLGAVVASGDFVYSMLTDSPNRKSLLQVTSFLEGKSEGYRVWTVLLNHWLTLNQRGNSRKAQPASLPASPETSSAQPVEPSAEAEVVAAAEEERAQPVDVAQADAEAAAEEEAALAGQLRDAMMEAVSAPLYSPRGDSPNRQSSAR